MRIWCAIVLLLCARVASAQVVAATTTSSGAQNGTGATFAHTTPAGSNRVLIVTCGIHVMTATSVTYNGVMMTFEGRGADTNPDFNVEMWSAVAPATGSHNVVVTLTGSNTFVCTATPLTGVDQSTPFGDVVTDGYSSSGTADNNTTICQANGLVLDGFFLNQPAGTIIVNSGQTTESGPTDTSGPERYILTSKVGGASVSTGYSWPNDFYRWAHISSCVNPIATASIGSFMTTGVTN